MKWVARVVGQMKIDPNDHVILDHAHMRGADYSGRKLKSFGAIGSRFEHCRFDNVLFEHMKFGGGREPCELIDCSFDGAKVEIGPGGFTRFVRCSFRNAEIRHWICFEVELIDCVFTGRMQECIFNGTVRHDQRPFLGRERNEFHGNDFSGADLVDVAFRTGIDLSKQRLPSGPEYLYLPDAPAALARAKSTAQTWSDSSLRKEVLLFLESFDFEIEGGQCQLLLRSDNYTNDSCETTDKVFALLRGSSEAKPAS